MNDHTPHVVIVGGGPIGLACGLEAQDRGIPHTIIEAGCIAHSIYQYPLNMKFFSTPELLEIGGIPFITPNDKPTRGDALSYYRRVAKVRELNLRLYERVLDVSGERGSFTVTSDKGTCHATEVILAIGFFNEPRTLDAPGADSEKVRSYFQEPHPFALQRVLVVGSGNSAAEAALDCWRAGADVTMAIRGDDFHEGLKYWVRPDIQNRIKHGEIPAHFNTTVKEVRDEDAVLERDGETFTVPCDHVLALIGYTPDFSFLKRVGVKLHDDENRTPAHNQSTFETNVPGVYLSGVVCGGLATNKWFIENSRDHAVAILDHIKDSHATA